MGIRLIVDVLQHAPMSLTHREKLLLVALAEDANDETRVTWNSVEHPKVLRGAKLSRAQLYAVLKKLIAKQVLSKVAAGQKNGTAKYKIEPFAAAQCQENADTETGSQRPGTADTDGTQRPRNADTDEHGQCQQNADTEQPQCQQNADVSVSKSLTPTPHPSATYPSASRQGEPAEPADTYGIPAEARSLIDAITEAGVTVRWPWTGDQWFPVLALIKKCGIQAMATYAVKTARRTDVSSARYFMRGWAELPPQPAPGTGRPALRAISGGHQPFQPPTDHSVYENGF